MTDNPNTSGSIDLPPLPKTPWATMLTTLLILFVFVGLVVVVLHYAHDIGTSPNTSNGEQQLLELRAAESETLNSYGYDAESKSYRIPIDLAMDQLIDDANVNGGQLKSFPALPKIKKEEPKKEDMK